MVWDHVLLTITEFLLRGIAQLPLYQSTQMLAKHNSFDVNKSYAQTKPVPVYSRAAANARLLSGLQKRLARSLSPLQSPSFLRSLSFIPLFRRRFTILQEWMVGWLKRSANAAANRLDLSATFSPPPQSTRRSTRHNSSESTASTRGEFSSQKVTAIPDWQEYYKMHLAYLHESN